MVYTIILINHYQTLIIDNSPKPGLRAPAAPSGRLLWSFHVTRGAQGLPARSRVAAALAAAAQAAATRGGHRREARDVGDVET